MCESILNKEELRQSMVAKFSSGKLEKKKLTSNEYRFLNSVSILGVKIENERSLSNNCYMFMFSCFVRLLFCTFVLIKINLFS